MHRIFCSLLAALLIAAPVACNGNGQVAENPKPPKAAEAQPKDVNVEIADFELKDLAGKTVSTAEARAGKVLVLKFGATWCPTCTQQIPHLTKAAEAYPGKVLVLEVDIGEPADKVRAHAAKDGAKHTILLDETGRTAATYRLRDIPTVIVAGKDGKIAYRGHYTPFKALKEKIDPLLE